MQLNTILSQIKKVLRCSCTSLFWAAISLPYSVPIIYSHYQAPSPARLGGLTYFSSFCIHSIPALSVTLSEAESFLFVNQQDVSPAMRATGNLCGKAIWHTTAPIITSVIRGNARLIGGSIRTHIGHLIRFSNYCKVGLINACAATLNSSEEAFQVHHQLWTNHNQHLCQRLRRKWTNCWLTLSGLRSHLFV